MGQGNSAVSPYGGIPHSFVLVKPALSLPPQNVSLNKLFQCERVAKMRNGKQGRYTLEFKQEAARLVESGKSQAAAARSLGVVEQTLGNWVKEIGRAHV